MNLLGRSMGGLDVRYAAHVLGSNKVASVTTNVPGIYYQSYSGSNVFNVSLGPSDALPAVAGVLFGFEPNNGLVGVNSAGWGNVRNLYRNANHLDEVNHLLGSTGLFGFNARGFFKDFTHDLQKRGY